MSEHIDKTISQLQQHIASLLGQANDAKKTINSLCKVVGRAPLYNDVDEQVAIVNAPLQGDEYHGRPLATVVREVLETRRAANLGPATIDELFQTMLDGGYEFTGKNEGVKKRGLSIALAKNMTFYRLPNDKFAIRDWYPSKAKEQPKLPSSSNGQKARTDDGLREFTDSAFSDAVDNEESCDSETATEVTIPAKPK